MSKDKIIFSFENRILFVILLFLCIFPFQLKNAFATDTSNYLPVCDNWDELVKKDKSSLKSQGYWVNYPFKQDGVSKECLPGPYCSDIIEGSHGRKKGSFLKGTDGQIEYQEVEVNVCISKDYSCNQITIDAFDKTPIAVDNDTGLDENSVNGDGTDDTGSTTTNSNITFVTNLFCDAPSEGKYTRETCIDCTGSIENVIISKKKVTDGLNNRVCKIKLRVPKKFYGVKTTKTKRFYRNGESSNTDPCSDLSGDEKKQCDDETYVYERNEYTTSGCTGENKNAAGYCLCSKNDNEVNCSDEPSTLYYEKYKSIFTGNNECFRKSCLDLTSSELQAINDYIQNTLQIYTSSDEEENSSRLSLEFYNFCYPFHYNGKKTINQTQNISYLINKTKENLFSSSDTETIPDKYAIYCHEFHDNESLKYVISKNKYIGYKNSSGKILGYNDSGTEEIDRYYHCILQQCALTSGQSHFVCESNFSLFESKAKQNNNFLRIYLENILSQECGNESECKYDNFTSLVGSSQCTKIDCEQSEEIFDVYYPCCTESTNNCNIIKKSDTPSTTQSGLIRRNKNCDKYEGVPNELELSNKSRYDTLVNTAAEQQCSSGGWCKRTVDLNSPNISKTDIANSCGENVVNRDEFLCSVYNHKIEIENEIKNEENLIISTNDTLDTDNEFDEDREEYLAYFYKPVPPSQATEIVNGKTIIKRILLGRDNANTMVKNVFGVDNYNSLSPQVNESSMGTNYFKYLRSGVTSGNDYRGNICSSGGGEFKDYGHYDAYANKVERAFKITRNYGEYYNGFLGVDRNAPHIVPLCEGEKPTIKPFTRMYMCGNSNYLCNAPYWDSYYYKVKPKIIWSSEKPIAEEISMEVCLRTLNSVDYGICGDRECNVDCGFGACALQNCGNDKCVKLTYQDGCDCSLTAMSKVGSTYPSSNCRSKCAKEPIDGVRFRANVVNGKLYVFLDVSDLSCTVAQDWIGEMEKNRDENRYVKESKGKVKAYDYVKNVGTSLEKDMTGGGETIGTSGNKSTIGGTFRGKMTKDSMLDDNELNDNNNDGVITDEDVFGEYLYSRCHNTDITLTNDEKYFCESMRTGTSTQHNDRAQDLTNHWITFDIVQFVGNNQPQDGDNCRIGSLHNCRGYYDAEGKFHKEQQGFSVPLATSPNPFYKYATINNSPDLFIPILQVIAINDHYNNTGSILQDLSGLSSSGNEVVFDANNLNNSNDIALDYFEPEIKVQYGSVSYDNDKNPRWLKMKFNETTQQTGNFGQNVYEFFETDFRNEKLCTSYYLEKGATIYPAPSANVCLKQINNCNCIQSSNGLFQCGTNNQDNITVQKIKCFTRKNPSPYYFLIKPVSDSINTMTPYANAYFYNRKNSINSTEPLKNNSNDILRFYNTLSLNESIMTEANAKITSGNYAYSQGYPIYLSKGECAIVNYNCIDTKKQYQARQRQGESENTAEMMLLMKNLKLCEQYELNCLAASGGSTSVQKKNSDGTYSVIDIKDSGGYNLNGQQNNMCVTSGFEDYIPYVKAYKTYNSISVGKCILDEDSKKKSECRRQEYYTFCSQRSNTCKCLDGTNTCTCNGTNCIETHSCNCSGNNCTQLDSACYLPGYNSLGTLLKADGTVDRICKCELITSQDVNNSNVETGFEYRKATPEELGFCIKLRSRTFCEPIKYYDRSKYYRYSPDKYTIYDYDNDGNGSKIDDSNKGDYISHIWRTDEQMYGQYKYDLGHAEFDKATAGCSDNLTDDEKKFCLTEKIYYNLKNKKHQFNSVAGVDSGNGGDWSAAYAQIGSCNGFWKQVSDELPPLATCQEVQLGDGETIGQFSLIDGTGCIRYSCDSVAADDSGFVTSNEAKQCPNGTIGCDDKSENKINKRGSFHGFAEWSKYTKGSDSSKNKNGDVPPKGDNNIYGDTLEERVADRCIQGFGPAGLNYILDKYMPVLTESDFSEYNYGKTIDDILETGAYNADVLEVQDNVVKKLIGENDDFDMNTFTNYNNSYLGGYNAKEHLPVRYCSQLGNWLASNDIYNNSTGNNNLFYYVNNPVYNTSSNFEGKGYLTKNAVKKHKYNTEPSATSTDFNVSVFNYDYNTTSLPDNTKNTYGENIRYRERYCERLFCKAYNANDVQLLSLSQESSLPGSNNVNYPNNEINKYTTWRHLGGATWQETPAPRSIDSEYVTGVCQINKGFYNSGNYTFGNFINQKGLIPNNYKAINLIDNNNILGISDSEAVKISTVGGYNRSGTGIEPTRSCSKWGIWSDIDNKCDAICPPIDTFTTVYRDDNNDGMLQSSEVKALFKERTEKDTYCTGHTSVCSSTKVTGSGGTNCSDENIQNCTSHTFASGLLEEEGTGTNKIQYGNKYSGGATWNPARGGTIQYGECDTDSVTFIKQDYNSYLSKNGGTSGVISKLQNGQNIGIKNSYGKEINNINSMISEANVQNKPFRACLQDGTWGPVVNPCVKANVCSNKTITGENFLNIFATNKNNVNYGSVFKDGTVSIIKVKDIKVDDLQSSLSSAKIDSQNVANTCNNNFSNCSINGICKNNTGIGKYFIQTNYGIIQSKCNINNGTWSENTSERTSTCLLKGCHVKDLDSQFSNTERLVYSGCSVSNNVISCSGTNSALGDSSNTTYNIYYPKELGITGTFTLTGKDVNNANKTYNYKGSSISATCVSGYTSTNSNNTVEYTCSGDISSYNGTTLTCQNSGTCHSDKNRSNYQYTNNTYNSSNIGTGFVNGSAIGNTSGNSGNNKNGGTFNSNSNAFSSVSQGVWVRKGECRPIVCKGEKLSTLLSGKNAIVLTSNGSKYEYSTSNINNYIGTNGSNIISNTTNCSKTLYAKNSTSAGCYSNDNTKYTDTSYYGESVSTYGIFSQGVKVKVMCGTGYYNTKTSASASAEASVEAVCGNDGEWSLSGEIGCERYCDITQLNTGSATVSNGSFNTSSLNNSYRLSTNSSNVAYNYVKNGGVITGGCNSGYSYYSSQPKATCGVSGSWGLENTDACKTEPGCEKITIDKINNAGGSYTVSGISSGINLEIEAFGENGGGYNGGQGGHLIARYVTSVNTNLTVKYANGGSGGDGGSGKNSHSGNSGYSGGKGYEIKTNDNKVVVVGGGGGTGGKCGCCTNQLYTRCTECQCKGGNNTGYSSSTIENRSDCFVEGGGGGGSGDGVGSSTTKGGAGGGGGGGGAGKTKGSGGNGGGTGGGGYSGYYGNGGYAGNGCYYGLSSTPQYSARNDYYSSNGFVVICWGHDYGYSSTYASY